MICVLPLPLQSEEDLWEDPVGSSRAYKHKQILACVTRSHKWRIHVLAEKDLCEEKNFFVHMSVMITDHEFSKAQVFV